jgi:predicted secreted protein
VRNNNRVLKPLGQEFEPPTNPIPGAAGYQVFRFQAAQPGRSPLALVYPRPWEPKPEPAATFRLKVVVNNSL